MTMTQAVILAFNEVLLSFQVPSTEGGALIEMMNSKAKQVKVVLFVYITIPLLIFLVKFPMAVLLLVIVLNSLERLGSLRSLPFIS